MTLPAEPATPSEAAWLIDVEFVEPSLRALDDVEAELLVASLPSGERPPRGVAGLLDWRLSAGLSRLVAGGFVTGALGERTLLWAGPKLAVRRLLLLGAGPSEALDGDSLRVWCDALLDTLAGLGATRTVIELPLREGALVREEEQLLTLLHRARETGARGHWTLVASASARRELVPRLKAERLRAEALSDAGRALARAGVAAGEPAERDERDERDEASAPSRKSSA